MISYEVWDTFGLLIFIICGVGGIMCLAQNVEMEQERLCDQKCSGVGWDLSYVPVDSASITGRWVCLCRDSINISMWLANHP